VTPLSLEGLLELAGKATTGPYMVKRYGNDWAADVVAPFPGGIEWVAGSDDAESASMTLANAEYFAACSPEVVRALVRLAQCAKALDDGLLDMGDSYRAPAVLCEALNEALGGIEGVVK
jgi:hypothetical protein